jgi:two-component system nitrate/nitrite response regulator NarL
MAAPRCAMAWELLGRQPDLCVLRLYGGARDLLEHLPEGELVLLYDLATAHQDGAARVMKVRDGLPGAKILMFNVTDDDQAIIECVRIGASGCVLQDASLEELVDAVRGLARGKPAASPRILTSLFSYVASLCDEDHRPLVPKLTEREEQILRPRAEGLSNQDIAWKLFLRPQTVKNYVHLLFQKLDVHSRLEVIRSLRAGRR